MRSCFKTARREGGARGSGRWPPGSSSHRSPDLSCVGRLLGQSVIEAQGSLDPGLGEGHQGAMHDKVTQPAGGCNQEKIPC